MKCTECGAMMPTPQAPSVKGLNGVVKAATSPGNKLKSLGRKRPDEVQKGMSRGGKYARD